MKKQIVAVALSSVLCLSGASLVACGGSSSSSNNTANNTANTTATTTNTNNTASNTSNTLGGNTSNSSASGLSQSQAETIAVDFLRNILSNKAGNADVSQSTYQFTNVTGSSSEGYTFTGNGTLCDSNGSALAHGASYSFEIKVSPDGNADLRDFNRGN